MHIHARSTDGEAKFWLEPELEFAQNWGLPAKDLRLVRKLLEAHGDDIRTAWQKHFG